MQPLFASVLALCAVASSQGSESPWNASWIWSEAPAQEVWFRKTLTVPRDVSQAKIAITADNRYELFVNGSSVGSDDDWTTVETYDVTRHVRKGPNVVAVKAADTGGGAAALLVEGAVIYTDGSVTVFGTDGSWRVSAAAHEVWTGLDFDDVAWLSPKVIGKPPVGPWGGIEPPGLVPGAPLETLSISWPGKAKPGDTFSVKCRVRLGERAVTDSPVALRLLSGDEPVCEYWVNAPVPLTSWKPGAIQEVVFRDFRLPAYVPAGPMWAQVVTSATESLGARAVTVGAEPAKPKPRAATVADFEVRQQGRDLVVSAKAIGAKRKQGYLFALMKGREMWLAADIASPNARVALPPGLPGGTYEAVLLPYQAPCPAPARVAVDLDATGGSEVQALGYGTYEDRDGIPHRWYINRAGALIWDGKPYIPAGAMFISKFFLGYRMAATEQNEANFKDDVKRLAAMKDAGVTDLYLNLCVNWAERPAWVWERYADLCEQMGIRYGIQVTNELRPLTYYDVSDDDYNVTVRGAEPAVIDLPNTLLSTASDRNEVLFAAFDATDDRLLEWGRAGVSATRTGVRAEAKRTIPSAGPVMVHFTPVYTYTGGMRDYWSSVNATYRARLDRFFSSLSLGPGLRCWIDPLDNEQSLQDRQNRKLPHSPEFQAMFADHLKRQYPNLEALVRDWAISGPLEDADHGTLARLVPIGRPSPKTDVQHLLDETTGRTFQIVPSRSAMWTDMLQFRDRSVAEFNIAVADMIKKHHDVPVVLKHEGTDIYTNTRRSGGFDGLGAEAYGTDNQHIRDVSAAVHAQSKQCGRTMWELTTETGMARREIGYPDPMRLIRELGSMIEMGGKGTYCFLIKDANGSPTADWYTFNLFEDPRQVWWLGAYGRLLRAAPSLPGYRPETFRAGDFWRDVLGLNILDLGPAFQAVRFGSAAYIWNMTGEPLTLRAEAPGSPVLECERGARTFTVAADAAKPVVIERAEHVTITGVEDANSLAAARLWNKAKAGADEIGVPTGSPPVTGWRDVWARAEELSHGLGDAAAVRMDAVTVDGDLAEWSRVKPIYLKSVADVADSRFGGAVLYVGYDENYLYIAGSVADDAVANSGSLGRLWDGDALEVFVDLHPAAAPGVAGLNSDCFQFIFAPTSGGGKPAMTVISPSLPPISVPGNSLWAVSEGENGWRFEAAISRLDLNGYQFQPGGLIGFEVQLDQGDGAGRAETRLWHGGPDAFHNRLGYGRLVFGGLQKPG